LPRVLRYAARSLIVTWNHVVVELSIGALPEAMGDEVARRPRPLRPVIFLASRPPSRLAVRSSTGAPHCHRTPWRSQAMSRKKSTWSRVDSLSLS